MRKTAILLSFSAALLLSSSAGAGLFSSNGYPSRGRAIDALKPAADYSDLVKNRPLAISIMRTRGQGFVPSPELQGYVNGVMTRLLAGVPLPPSFRPEVHILATPEFAGECTPDGTLIISVGLLELLETEDELAFVMGHELAHAILRHQQRDFYKKAQFYAVVHGVAVDSVAQSVLGDRNNANVARALDVAQHMAKLSSNLLMPQMAKEDEDAADALGFDLMVKAGYDPEAPLAVMDKLAQQEAEAQAAADAAKAATKNDEGGGSGGSKSLFDKLGSGLDTVTSIATGHISKDQAVDVAIFAFDTAVDSMADDATTHHPAKERADLLSAYLYGAYRDAPPVPPTPLPWAPNSKSPLKLKLTALFAHYTDAENASAYIADASQGTAASAQAQVGRATQAPTVDHAYTDFVAAEFYDGRRQAKLSEAALVRAANGPEPSWEIYSKLIDVYVSRRDYGHAQALMDRAVVRFEDSPVLLPKRIQLFKLAGREADAQALVPKCKSYDIDELTQACKKEAG
jgi:Zn-dependent protease with chaperone function